MRLNPRLRPGVVAIAATVPAAILLVACSSPPSRPSKATSPASTSASTTSSSVVATTVTTTAFGNFNSCSVVTQAEAAKAIGESVTPGVPGTASVEGGIACVFYGPSAPTPTNPNLAQADSVRVMVMQGSEALTWYNDFKPVSAQPIAGYGEQGYYDGTNLNILKGGLYLRISVTPGTGPPNLSDEEQLATVILPEL